VLRVKEVFCFVQIFVKYYSQLCDNIVAIVSLLMSMSDFIQCTVTLALKP